MANDWRQLADLLSGSRSSSASSSRSTSSSPSSVSSYSSSDASPSSKSSSNDWRRLADELSGSRKQAYSDYSNSVAQRVITRAKKKDEEDKKWYEKGHFEDGWDFGDITKTILGIDDDSASLKDLTVGSLKKGYYNARYGEETFKAMNGGKNQKDAIEQILEGDEYQFTPGNDFAGAVSGAMELIGQQVRQFTNPRTLALTGTAAGAAAVAGQAGPQVLLPEEIITVPAAATAAFAAGSATSNLEIEAGHAYNEMLESGISEETARKVALGVGTVNAGLELLQVDELIDAYKVTKASGATKTVAKKILDELVERGVDVGIETAQEVMQEGVTITGTQLASMKDKGEYAYTADDVKGRLKDTAKSSALSFGLMNAPATVKNTASIINNQKKVNPTLNVAEEASDFDAPIIEKQEKKAEKTESVSQLVPQTEIVEETPFAEAVKEDLTTEESFDNRNENRNWREVAKSLREPEVEGEEWTREYIDYNNSVRSSVMDASIKEVISDVENGLTSEELSQKAENALQEYEQVQAQKDPAVSYTEAEQLTLTTLYNQYTLYSSVAKDPSFVNELKKSLDTAPTVETTAPTVSETENVAPEFETVEVEEPEPLAPAPIAPEVATPNVELEKLEDRRQVLQDTIMSRHEVQMYDADTEKLAKEWNKVNREIAETQASIASDSATTPVVENSVDTVDESVPGESQTEESPAVEEAKPEAEKPKTTAEKARDYYRDGLLSFDRVFPNEEKTPEKQARFESLKKATKDAQDFIANGTDGVKPLADIFRKVQLEGNLGDFELYLRHLLNIDRTTLKERFDKEDLPVFGEEEWKKGERIVKWFTNADQSREIVVELEKAHPEFKQYREDVYAFNNYLNKMLVDGGGITQETADLWAERYPHYIPISRSRHSEQVSAKLFDFLNFGIGEYTYKDDGFDLFDKDVISSTPTYSIRATGTDFHPLIDTMVDRALRTYWTVANNQLDVSSDLASEDYQSDTEAPFAESVDDVVPAPETVVDDLPIAPETEAPIDSSAETPDEGEITQEEFDSLNELGQELVAEEENTQQETVEATEETTDDVAPDVAEVEQSAPVATEEVKEEVQAEETSETTEEETEAEEIEIEPSPERRDDLLHKRFGLFQALSVFGADDGLRFEIIGKKEGVSLDASWQAIRNSFGAAQHFIGKGKAGTDVKSLSGIVKKVTSKKATKDFNSYLKHLRNIDNMTMHSRYGVADNNRSIGISADKSYKAVRDLEAKHPEFAEWASECYENADYIRQQFVEHGFLTQEQAELWKELYPHWLPFRKETGSIQKVVNGIKALQERNLISSNTARNMNEFFLMNAPSSAFGGKHLPMLETMAQFTSESFHSFAMNDFASQLKDVLHTDVKSEGFSIDDFVKQLDSGVSLFEFDKSGDYYTCTTYQNGEKVTFEIDKEMYIAMSDSFGWMNMKIPVLHQVNEGFRKLCTEWNIFFSLKNGVKDPQDIIYNSQHPLETYAELAHAAEAIAFKESSYRPYYEEYLANGGESSTYFDSESGKFSSWKNPSELVQYATGLKAVIDINNRVETNPRLAEYIASRKAGRTVQEAMLDSARVTTNFAAGGKFTKFLNRNGCTFLNASVQGALQHARNFVESATDADGKLNLTTKEAKLAAVKGTSALIARGLIAGMTAIAINDLRWKDDEDYEELPDYVKDGYYLLFKYGDGQFFRLPKGRTNATIEKGLRTVADQSFGDDNADWESFWKIVIENIAPNNVATDNILAPIREVGKGETWYGEDMIPYRLKDKKTTEQFDEKTDTISIDLSKKLEAKLNDITLDEWLNEKLDGTWLGEKLAGFRDGLSPKEINYLMNSYTGVLGDLVLPYHTPKAESPYNDPLSQSLAPLRDIFTTDSVLNNKATEDFYETLESAEALAESEEATAEDKLKAGILIGYNVELSDLYEEQRNIQMDENLSDSEKYEQTREIKKKINELQEQGLKAIEDYSMDGNYAESGDKRYNYDAEDDTWWEVKPKLADGKDNWYYIEEQLFHDKLGVDYADYWNGRLDPEDYDVKSMYAEYGGKRYNFDMKENSWFEIKPKTKDGEDNYYYQMEQTAHDKWGVSYEDFWNNREAYMDAVYVADNWGEPFFETAKSVFGIDKFSEIASGMADISADKDANGESISGSRKKKMKDYIYGLDIPEVEKHILFKAQYPYTKTYNTQIVNYLNERKDISYKEMKSILEELGAKVDSKGYIKW